MAGGGWSWTGSRILLRPAASSDRDGHYSLAAGSIDDEALAAPSLVAVRDGLVIGMRVILGRDRLGCFVISSASSVLVLQFVPQGLHRM
jgi:hypothetical protein